MDKIEYVRGIHVTTLITGWRSQCVYEASGFCTSRPSDKGSARQGWRTIKGAPSNWYHVWKAWCDSRDLYVARPRPWLQKTMGTQTGDLVELSPTTADTRMQTASSPEVSANYAGTQGAGAAKAADGARHPLQTDDSAGLNTNDGRRPKRGRTDPTDLIDLASSSDKDDDNQKRGSRPWRCAAGNDNGPPPEGVAAKDDNPRSRRDADNNNDKRPNEGVKNDEQRPDNNAAPNAQPGFHPRRGGCRSGRKVRE